MRYLRLEVSRLLPHAQAKRRLVVVTWLPVLPDILATSLRSPAPVKAEPQAALQAPWLALSAPIPALHLRLRNGELPAACPEPGAPWLRQGSRAAIPSRLKEDLHIEAHPAEASHLHIVSLKATSRLGGPDRWFVARLCTHEGVQTKEGEVIVLPATATRLASRLRVQHQGEPPVLLIRVLPNALVAVHHRESLVHRHGQGANPRAKEAALPQLPLRPVGHVLVALAPVLHAALSEHVVEVGA
mmetsp:Transcript_95444/g.204802  ORF Transcript_95444/g.204802 Transcript_95444/m.204802 type:complete len:243 (-) Transcript_95444:351-1079(-)